MPSAERRATPIQPRGAASAAVRRRNKEAALRVMEAFNTGNLDIVDEVTHPRLVSYTPKPGLDAHRRGLKQQIQWMRHSFPDARFRVQEVVAEGDVVYLRWRMTGTHKGKFLGRAPTGRKIDHQGHEVMRLKQGKIIEHRDSFEMMAFLDKLGMLDGRMLKRLRTVGLRPNS